MRRLGVIVLAALLIVTGHSTAIAADSTVTASVNKRTAVAGDAVRISGVITPRVVGTRVQLQEKRGKRWVKVAQKQVRRSDGKYVFRYRPTRVGRVVYRVFKLASSDAPAAHSRRVAVKMFRWHYLSDFDHYSEHRFNTYGYEVTIAGGIYKKSLTSEPSFISASDWHVEYNLRSRCRQLTGVAGLNDDESDTGSRGELELTGDSALLYGKEFGLGDSEQLAVDVSGVLRIRIDAFGLLGAEGTIAAPAVGTPRVLCSF